MNTDVLLTQVPKRMAWLELQKLAKQYQAEYGNLVRIGNKIWAQLSDNLSPDYLGWAVKRFNFPTVLLCCEVEHRVLVVAWHEQDAICNQIVPFEQLPSLCECLKNIEGFKPKVLYFSEQQNIDSVLQVNWQEREKVTDWPMHYRQIPLFSKITNPLKKILSISFFLSAIAWLTIYVWPNAPENEQHTTMENTGIHFLLSQSPGAVAPLLELDTQLQRLFYQIPGWEVSLVEFRQGVLRYRMQRSTGNLKDLRNLAEKLNTTLVVQGEDIWLHRHVALPPALSDFTALDELNPLIHLEDHLDDSVRLFIPGSRAQFQTLNTEEGWGIRRVQVMLEGHFPEDLITLSSLLDGLPIRLIEVNYRVRNNQIYGHVIIDIYGVHN